MTGSDPEVLSHVAYREVGVVESKLSQLLGLLRLHVAILRQDVVELDIWVRINDLNRACRNLTEVSKNVDRYLHLMLSELDFKAFSNI